MTTQKRFVTITDKRRIVIEAPSRLEAELEFYERYGYNPGFNMEEVATND